MGPSTAPAIQALEWEADGSGEELDEGTDVEVMTAAELVVPNIVVPGAVAVDTVTAWHEYTVAVLVRTRVLVISVTVTIDVLQLVWVVTERISAPRFFKSGVPLASPLYSPLLAFRSLPSISFYTHLS
jgi:hypothetical protein